MLRIAVPNKGSLAEPAAEMLREAGYRGRRDHRELVLIDADNEVEFFYLRPRDIAVYVGSGTLDVGITGRDLMLDSGSPAQEVLPLGFGRSTFHYAAPDHDLVDSRAGLAGKRIATSFPGLVRADLARHDVTAEVVRLDGAVETAVTLGVADLIADVVETGTTLRQAGLAVCGEPILESEAVLIRRQDSPSTTAIEVLARRIQGVLTAQRYVMMDYDIRAELVEQAVGLTPGLESPTVSPLHDEAYVAVRSMVPREQTNRLMDSLYELGARAILVTEISACRL
jgi:ATP phosphoribosyltransferase